MNFEKKNSIYKTIMLIFITAIITFLITAIGVSNYYEKTETGLEKVIETNKTASDLDTKISTIRAYLNNVYLGDFPEEDELIESAIKGYVAGLGDEYTEYLTKEDYEELMTSVVGNYVGIGVYMSQDRYGNVVILLPIEGSPAEEKGLKTGDIIKKVNGEDCQNMELSLVASKVKGEEGTTVNLEILREKETFTIDIERRNVKLNQMKSEALENNIGYIKILSFDENCSKEFEQLLDELLEKNIKSLIIDVRDNGGGIVSEATNIANLFLEKDKVIMQELGKDSKEEVITTKKDAKVDSNLKIVILENENSASASELLIGALKENERATIIGVKSFGKGVMQEILPVSTGGALKVTIQEFRTPSGNVINKRGIEPDILVEDDKDTKEDEQLQKAIKECKK